ncbi:hypothetical protein RirG_031410 [Rhizophagus irregularis DAOM 197198w]|uniref:Uncharacterized protein n=1 Tax=Rhizophagus irregularis (strain DAOM 197198w) TaxID=1432141 RepID=A0A015LVB5_RHIIW|nr:hypothetical protein RirG_031410 [Rhizophagus irregularis DAOM 197198w]
MHAESCNIHPVRARSEVMAKIDPRHLAVEMKHGYRVSIEAKGPSLGRIHLQPDGAMQKGKEGQGARSATMSR